MPKRQRIGSAGSLALAAALWVAPLAAGAVTLVDGTTQILTQATLMVTD